jgi:hypothetical protein
MKKQVLTTNTFKGFEDCEVKEESLTQIKGGIVIEEELIG